jgi:hypothetical protein
VKDDRLEDKEICNVLICKKKTGPNIWKDANNNKNVLAREEVT